MFQRNRSTIDAKHTWLTEGLYVPSLTPSFRWAQKDAKAKKGPAVDVIFKTYSRVIKTKS